eukprot:11299999-Alexandrium_andersonii.AAC.1
MVCSGPPCRPARAGSGAGWDPDCDVKTRRTQLFGAEPCPYLVAEQAETEPPPSARIFCRSLQQQ